MTKPQATSCRKPGRLPTDSLFPQAQPPSLIPSAPAEHQRHPSFTPPHISGSQRPFPPNLTTPNYYLFPRPQLQQAPLLAQGQLLSG